MSPMRGMVFAVAVGLVLALPGCGGATVAAPEVPAAAPAPVVERDPPRRAVDDRMWHVFWDGLHVLTVYPEGGMLRSRQPAERVSAPWGERSPRFSVISLYSQTEARFTPLLEAAADVDDLVRRIEALEDMEIVQEQNPAYAPSF